MAHQRLDCSPALQAELTGLTLEERVHAVEHILGYTFIDKSLVERAITHSSAVEAQPHLSYQRLEFLGDAVVDLCVAEYAYRQWPDVDEGILTKMRVGVVKGTFLSEKQREAGFEDLIIFGASERSQSARGMARALEDCFESLTGALYLDGGYDVAYGWVISQLGEYVAPAFVTQTANPKSELQERVQSRGGVVEYRIIDESGPPHAPSFTAEALINGKPKARATGFSKKEAEAAAAARTLEDMR